MGQLDIAIQVPKSHGSHARKERVPGEDLQMRYNRSYIDKDNDEDGNQPETGR